MGAQMITVRLATVADAADLIAIYKPYVETTTITFEEETPSVAEFRRRIQETLKTHPYLIAEDSHEILGYAYAHFYNSRMAYQWTAETTVYVKEGVKAKGIGTRLSQELETLLAKQGVLQLMACITAENQTSLNFHHKIGYRQVGMFPEVGYKWGHWCGIIWMQKELAAITDPPKAIVPFANFSK